MNERGFSTGAGLLLAAGGLAAVLLGYANFAPREMIDGQLLANGSAVQIVDGYTSLAILFAGDGEVALVDCGDDPRGAALLGALADRGLGPDAVKAIFLTHGHADHVAGCHLFPEAEVYAFAPDVPVAAGKRNSKGPLTRFRTTPEDKAARVTATLEDGETVFVGSLAVRAFALPGHTAGSAAYLSSGVLYLGDSAGARANGTVRGASWLWTDDCAQNLAELRRLYTRLKAEGDRVTTLAFAHTGPHRGLEGLLTVGE